MMLTGVAVIVVAILLATYRLSRLESERGRRDATIEQEFENVVTFLHQQLDAAKYRVLRIAPPPHARNKLHAMVVNNGFAIPRVGTLCSARPEFCSPGSEPSHGLLVLQKPRCSWTSSSR
jgi:hypothetical protein